MDNWWEETFFVVISVVLTAVIVTLLALGILQIVTWIKMT